MRRWREENPEQWRPDRREIDAAELYAALDGAERISLDPYLLVYVVMGAEWLFRARPLTRRDVEASLDQFEFRLRRMAIADFEPWRASLLVGASARAAFEGLKRARYLVSLGLWAAPMGGWRDFLPPQKAAKSRPTGEPLDSPKAGKIPTLSPIVAGIIVEGLAERAGRLGKGGKALALRIASLLRGRAIQRGEYGVWRRAVSIPAAGPPVGAPDATQPPTLREWLIRRWASAYENAFVACKRDWAGYLVEAAYNPHALFGPVADPDVVSLLYSLSWYHEVSPRRPPFTRKPTRRART